MESFHGTYSRTAPEYALGFGIIFLSSGASALSPWADGAAASVDAGAAGAAAFPAAEAGWLGGLALLLSNLSCSSLICRSSAAISVSS